MEQERSTLDDAKSFLIAQLKADPKAVSDLQAEAIAAGHSWTTIRRAKAALKIDSRKSGMNKGWVWELLE